MSNQERESLIFRLEQLEQHQKVLAKYMTVLKSQLDNISEQFNNRPELQLVSLQGASSHLHKQFNEPSALPVEGDNVPTEEVSGADEIQQQATQVQSSEYQLVFDRSGSRAVLMEALEKAQERLIIVCPWLNRNSIDAGLMQKFRVCLNRNCCIEIGWGHLSDRGKLGKGWRYNALKDLRELERNYPDQFKLKLLRTHEKFLVCDSLFAMLGSHNILTSSVQSAEREIGIHTTDPHIIQGLINRFDGAEVQDAQSIVESLTAGAVRSDDEELDIGEESDAILVNPDDGQTDQDVDDFAQAVQGIAVNVEEFLRRYEAGERNFTEINLAYADLSGASLNEVNLSNANLTGADLRKTKLNAAYLKNTKLTGTRLNGAVLIQAHLCQADLSKAKLSEANLTGAYLPFANLTNASLKGTNLAAADLNQTNLTTAEFNDQTRFSGANLRFVNLAGQDLQKLNLSGVDLTKANLCGAKLCCSNLSAAKLHSADLRGADLSGANLEKVNLERASLSGADLKGAKLGGAIMPDGTIHD